jgi:hypothetical protein
MREHGWASMAAPSYTAPTLAAADGLTVAEARAFGRALLALKSPA